MLGTSVFFSSELVLVVDVSVVVVLVAGLPVDVVPEGRVAGLDVSGLPFELGLLVSAGRVAGLPVVVEPAGGVVGLVAPGLYVSVGREGSGLTVGVVGFSGCGLTEGAGFSGCGLPGFVGFSGCGLTGGCGFAGGGVGRTGYTGYTGTGFGSITVGGVLFSYMKSYLLNLPLKNSTAYDSFRYVMYSNTFISPSSVYDDDRMRTGLPSIPSTSFCVIPGDNLATSANCSVPQAVKMNIIENMASISFFIVCLFA
ncbi:MAG: hypothetical protein ACK5M3_11315 [Dysgonomonas sp.]